MDLSEVERLEVVEPQDARKLLARLLRAAAASGMLQIRGALVTPEFAFGGRAYCAMGAAYAMDTGDFLGKGDYGGWQTRRMVSPTLVGRVVGWNDMDRFSFTEIAALLDAMA